MLVALCALAVAGCGGKNALSPQEVVAEAFDDLRDQVTQIVGDTQRRSTAVELVNRLEQDYDTLYATVEQRRTRVRALHADYDATRESLIALADQLESDMREARKATGVTHRELMAAMTADEWAKVSKANTRTMKAAIAALQSI